MKIVTALTQFQANVPFICPPKTESQIFCDTFGEYRKERFAWNGLFSCNGINTDDSQPNGSRGVASLRTILIKIFFKEIVKDRVKVNKLRK